MAVRFNCPIYTYEFIMESAGVILEDVEEQVKIGGSTKQGRSETSFEKFSTEELNKMLQQVLADEDYEKAAKIRDEINKRK